MGKKFICKKTLTVYQSRILGGYLTHFDLILYGSYILEESYYGHGFRILSSNKDIYIGMMSKEDVNEYFITMGELRELKLNEILN